MMLLVFLGSEKQTRDRKQNALLSVPKKTAKTRAESLVFLLAQSAFMSLRSFNFALLVSPPIARISSSKC